VLTRVGAPDAGAAPANAIDTDTIPTHDDAHDR